MTKNTLLYVLLLLQLLILTVIITVHDKGGHVITAKLHKTFKTSTILKEYYRFY